MEFHKRQFLFFVCTIALLLVLFALIINEQNTAQRTPGVHATPTGLSFPDRECRITDFGARSDDQAATTRAIMAAIDTCAKAGGGRVIIPSGTWPTGAIKLAGNINLHIEEGATLLFSSVPEDYLPIVPTRFVGLDVMNYAPAIYAANVSNVAITGSGTIDGNGAQWPNFIERQRKAIRRLYKMSFTDTPLEERRFGTRADALRPSLVQFYNARDVLVEGVTIRQGPMWTLHLLYTNRATVRNIAIIANGSNTDGIVIDSSQDIAVTDCAIQSGDDAIAIKSGRDRDGLRRNIPTRNVTIRNITTTRSHTGIAFGSEMSGGIENVLVDTMTVSGANRGIRFKTLIGRGGFVRNVTLRNIIINRTREAEAIQMTMRYGSRTMRPKTKDAPLFEKITFDTITTDIDPALADRERYAISLRGIPGGMRAITFRDIVMEGERTIAVDTANDIAFIDTTAAHIILKEASSIKIAQEECPEITQSETSSLVLKCP